MSTATMTKPRGINKGLATRHVSLNLNKSDNQGGYVWQHLSLASLDDFTANAKAWLGDKSELSGRTIDNADYAELLDYFRELADWAQPVRFVVIATKKQFVVHDTTTGQHISGTRRAARSGSEHFANALNDGTMVLDAKGRVVAKTAKARRAPKVVEKQGDARAQAREAFKNVRMDPEPVKTTHTQKKVTVAVSVPPVNTVSATVPQRKRSDVPKNWVLHAKEADTPIAQEWWKQWIERWIRGEVS